MLLPVGLNPGAYTPFTADNKLNANVLADELRRVTKGASGLHGPAGHSEFAGLTFDEWRVWNDVLVDVAHSAKIKSWSFLGAESFEKTLPYAEYAVRSGTDGLFVIAPYFNLYSQEAAYQYFKDFAGAFSNTPIIFYPAHQTGNHFTPSTIARIAEIPNIVGMKQSLDHSFDDVTKTLLLTKDIPNFNIVSGGLNLLYPLFAGADIKCSCSPMSNFAHEWCLNLWKAYLEKDWPTLEKWNKKLTRIYSVLNIADSRHVGSRAGHKAAITKLLGRDIGLPRRPGLPTTDEHVARIRKVWEEEGLI